MICGLPSFYWKAERTLDYNAQFCKIIVAQKITKGIIMFAELTKFAPKNISRVRLSGNLWSSEPPAFLFLGAFALGGMSCRREHRRIR
jgi:hypothetical protein